MPTVTEPLISICIPAYNRVTFLERLLDSIVIQDFKDFEVVITDDSTTADVEALCKKYSSLTALKYFKNEKPLGTPENWNEAIRCASGKWIKVMHDDDWFAKRNSLLLFVNAIQTNPKCEFFFCAYTNIYESTGKERNVFVDWFQLWLLQKNPVTLIANNVIGPPSVCIYKSKRRLQYDPKVKWVVDMEFYIRFLHESKPCYIPKLLVNVGMNNSQVTTYTFGVPEFHLKENLYLLNKTGSGHLKNIVIYDAWWRLLRNFKITEAQQFRDAGFFDIIPETLLSIINFQKKMPRPILTIGILSKILMFLCYVTNFKTNGK